MFILVFIIIQTAISSYLYMTIAAGLGRHSPTVAAVIGICFLSLFAAIYLERTQRYRASLPFAWLGYHWIGVAFLFATAAGMIDLVQIFVQTFTDGQAFQTMLILGGTTSFWGFIAARRVNVKRVRLTSPKMRSPLKVAQISDLHLGDSSSISRTRRIVDAIAEWNPDLVVSTGDLFDGYLDLMDRYVQILQSLKPPLGKFAVSGNHEVYAGLEQALDLTSEAGFTLLRNESRLIGASVAVAGIDDPEAMGSIDRSAAEERTFDSVHPAAYTIFLSHRPEIRPRLFDRFDLQLSGHTHGGQIFPFHIITKLIYRAKTGLSQLAKDTYLYLSRGTGSWGPQLRVFAPTELTFITIEPVSANEP